MGTGEKKTIFSWFWKLSLTANWQQMKFFVKVHPWLVYVWNYANLGWLEPYLNKAFFRLGEVQKKKKKKEKNKQAEPSWAEA